MDKKYHDEPSQTLAYNWKPKPCNHRKIINGYCVICKKKIKKG